MNHLWNIVRKELRELLTPATVLPMVLIVAVLAAMGPLMDSGIEQAMGTVEVGILNADTQDLDGYAALAVGTAEGVEGVDIVRFDDLSIAGDRDAVAGAMREKGVGTLLIISPDYSTELHNGRRGTITTYWYMSGPGGVLDMSETAAVRIVSAINNATSERLIQAGGGADPSFIRNPVPYIKAVNTWTMMDTGSAQGISPSDVSGTLMRQNMFVSIVMMMIIIMIGSILVSSIGSEKENKTLETLLTLPVGRTTVVGGKIIGSAAAGMLFGGVYLAGMYAMMGSVGNMGGADLGQLGLALSPADWIVVGATLFMSIVCALGLCMILGAFAKNYKAAQTLIMPITILAMIPMLLSVFGSFGTVPGAVRAVMFAIPFSHPMMVMDNLMFGNTAVIAGGSVYLVAFALATLYITVRLYRSDILLTGLMIGRRSKGE